MTKEKIKLCVAYCRVSGQRQKEVGLSLDAQEDYLKNWSQDNGYDIVKVFKVQESASKLERPKLFECFNYCVQNGVMDILITDSDRWTRSRELDINATKFIQKNNLTVLIVRERKTIGKFKSAADKFSHNVKTDVDEFFIDQMREKVGAGMKEKLAKNEYPTIAPLGYTNVERKKGVSTRIEPSEDFEKVKKFLLEFNKGKRSISKMINFANSLNLRSKSGRELHKSSIEYILKNRFYYGEFEYSFNGFLESKIYKNETPGFVPMISGKVWEKNQKILEQRKVNLSNERGKIKWKFKNFVYCGKCGRVYLAEKTEIKYKKKKKGKLTGETTSHSYVQYHCTKGHFFSPKNNELQIAEKFIQEDEHGNYFYNDDDVPKRNEFGEVIKSKKTGKRIYCEKRRCNAGCINEVALGQLLSQEFSCIQFKKSNWDKMKGKIFSNKEKEVKLITEELAMLRSEFSKNETREEVLLNEKLETDNKNRKELLEKQMEKIDKRQPEIQERIGELEAEKGFISNKLHKELQTVNIINDWGEMFKMADLKIKKKFIELLSSKIFIIGGEKIKREVTVGKKTKEVIFRVPFNLHVEWNEAFRELYNVDLIALPKEVDVKYGLPCKMKEVKTTTKMTFTNSKNSLDSLY